MNRLSTPVENIRDHYTVVVVGSGYGGAVTASRLARAGQSVCLLERGKEFQPGDFPDTELKAAEELQADTPPAHIGSRLGLFDLRVNDDMNVVVGCGLGGTSLINANVALDADPRVLADGRWPAALRSDIRTLEEARRHAEAMLRPVPYPQDQTLVPKLAALERSAAALGVACVRPPINVCFADGVNHVGVEQRACNLCGDCVSGCNIGAKNSLIMNYLPDARNHGAEIFTRVAVRNVERRGTHWIVHYQPVGEGREAFDAPPLFVSADVVILAAGALGSAEILLRSRAQGLPLSARVGERFTSNGDVMGFGYNNDRPMDGVGFGHHAPEGRPPVGPCITGLVDLRGTERPDDGMVIEEGSLPGALGRFLPAAFSAGDLLDGRDPREGWRRRLAKWWRVLVSALAGPYHGAVRHSQTYLVMAHDDAGGRMSLHDDRLRIAWRGVGEEPVFKRIDAALVKATRANGGDYVPNPIWSDLLGHRLVTVHPLGGAVMAERAEEGVVDHKGRVFSSAQGDAIHDGLYVCDGSVIPRSLGVNPLLTISTLAERCAALIARDRGWAIDYTLPSAAFTTAPRRVGISFTETMAGTVSPLTAAPDADFSFTFTIVSEDVDAMLSDPDHRARMVGTVTCPLLDREPLTATEGEFGLFVSDPDRVGTRRMTYRAQLAAEDGRRWCMEGYKLIRDDAGLDLWNDTTTLFITLRKKDRHGPVFARGVLKIAPDDFLRQLTTMRAINARGMGEELGALARFGRFFAGTLFETYGGVFARDSVFDADAPPRRKRPLRAPAPQVHLFRTGDGEDLHLTRYRGGDKGPVLLIHGLGVSSSIFSVDTIGTNLVEFLVAHGYDVWLLDYRASIALPTSRRPFNADVIAAQDHPAAVRTVLQLTGARDLQVVAHCFGSTTFVMAMLLGMQGVRSAVCSQIGAHVEVGTLAAEVKAGLHLPTVLHSLGVDSLTAYVDNHADWRARLFDDALKFSPVESGERCTSATCHRISFIYAPLYRHAQLNTATHDTLHELFGIADMEALEHLALMVRRGHVVTADDTDIYRLHPERLAIPLLFLHGEENRCFLPASTAATQLWLAESNGGGLYTRRVIPGYGHIDCILGAEAARDVFGHIVDHLDRH